MQEWLHNNDIFMHSIHNQGNSATAERFIKTLKTKIYEKMTANDNKCCFHDLIILTDAYNNYYNHFYYNKKPINADYSALNEKLRRILKLLSLKLMLES